MAPRKFNLRPGITSSLEWRPEESNRTLSDKLRESILVRDSHTCMSCGHRAMKFMNIHHLQSEDDNNPSNLCTLCVACHAVMHIGRNLQLGVIEIWASPLTQIEIVRVTRSGVKKGRSLSQIKGQLGLKAGKYPPNSVEWANDLLAHMGSKVRAELPEPLCAIFVGLKRWQIEP